MCSRRAGLGEKFSLCLYNVNFSESSSDPLHKFLFFAASELSVLISMSVTLICGYFPKLQGSFGFGSIMVRTTTLAVTRESVDSNMASCDVNTVFGSEYLLD